jgi:hypothetical protein
LASTDGDQRSWTYPRGHWQLEGVTREAGLEARATVTDRLPPKYFSNPFQRYLIDRPKQMRVET